MIIVRQVKEFIDFWYVGNTEAFWSLVKGIFGSLERELGVLANVYNWTKPLFQDNDYKGKIIGPIMRTMRIFAGVVVYLVLGAAFLLFYLILFLLPVLVLYMVWRNLYSIVFIR